MSLYRLADGFTLHGVSVGTVAGSSCVDYHMAVLCMAGVNAITFAWVCMCRLSYGSTLYGDSVITLVLGLLALVIIWQSNVWRQRKYLWPGSPCVAYPMAVLYMASA